MCMCLVSMCYYFTMCVYPIQHASGEYVDGTYSMEVS